MVVGSGPMAGLVHDYVHYLCCCLGALFVLCGLALFALHVYLFLFVLRFICITCLFIYCLGGKV